MAVILQNCPPVSPASFPFSLPSQVSHSAGPSPHIGRAVLHIVHSPFPLVPSSSRQRPPLDLTYIKRQQTTKPLCCPQYTHCKGHHTELLWSAERLRFLIPLFMLGSHGLCLICSSTSRASAYLSQVGFCVTAGNLEGVLRVKFPGSCFLPSSLIQQTHLPILPSFCLGTGSQKIQ